MRRQYAMAASRAEIGQNHTCRDLRRSRGYCSFFFFQAEDGIRDYKVTGVQTCALPISITEDGREELNKNCRIDTQRITELLIYAKQRIHWVQANLILTEKDDKEEIRK